MAGIETDPVGFQAWMLARKAHDNPRGDFVEDYRDRVRSGHLGDLTPEGELGPGVVLGHASMRELRKLVREWRAQNV